MFTATAQRAWSATPRGETGRGRCPTWARICLDTCRFWFGDLADTFRVLAMNRFENRAPDHVIIGSEANRPRLELEMTLCMWRNHFTCDVLAEKGTAHITSLCKWGPTTITHRNRMLPSGRPAEATQTLIQEDPTWAIEYAHFKKLCEDRVPTDLSNDLWLQRTLRRLAAEAQS